MPQQSESRDLDKVIARLPDGMRDKLKASAAANKRSLNAEIVERLERSFPTWPHIAVPTWIMERVNAASPEQRMGAEAQINTLVEDFLEQQFPDPFGDANGVMDQFSALVRRAPERLRPKFRQEMEKLVQSILDAEGAQQRPPAKKPGSE